MSQEKSLMTAKEALDLYFLDNRARMLEIAAFLDRIDRYSGALEAKDDFRYHSFVKAIKVISGPDKERTKNVQLLFSDLSAEPVEKVTDPKTYGAYEGVEDEGN